MNADSLETRLRHTYLAAVEAGHRSALVAIHLGVDVFDDLRCLATFPTESTLNTCWGYPVVRDESLDPDGIHVVTRTVIA